MGAAPDRLAMGVEDDELDIRKLVTPQQFGDPDAQALDPEGRGDLPDIAPGIRIAELDAQPPVALEIVAEMRAAQRLVDDARPLLQRVGGLEQRRDLDAVGDAEAARQPERAEQRIAGLGLRDQEAHGLRAVDMLHDLRDRHHHPRRRGPLGRQRPEIDRDRLDLVQRRIDGGEKGTSLRRLARLLLQRDRRAQCVVELRGVEPEMRQRDRDAMREAARPDQGERNARFFVGDVCQGLVQGLDQAGSFRQCRLALLHQRQRKSLQGLQRGLRADGRRQSELPLDGGECFAHQPTHGFRGRVLRQLFEDARELPALRFQPVAQRVPPADIGASIRVAADPGGERDRLRRELRPPLRPALAGNGEEGRVQTVDGIAGMAHGIARLLELVLQGDPPVRAKAECAIGDDGLSGRAAGSEIGKCMAKLPRHAEGRMGCEHSCEARPLRRLPERVEGRGLLGRLFRQRGENSGFVILEPDIARDPAGALMQGLPPEPAHQFGGGVHAQLAAIHQPRQPERDAQHRIAERVVAGIAARRLDAGEQLLDETSDIRGRMTFRSDRSGHGRSPFSDRP